MIPPFSSANNTSGNSKSANSNSGEQRLISPIGRSEDQNDNKNPSIGDLVFRGYVNKKHKQR